jgi:hypothetical protein
MISKWRWLFLQFTRRLWVRAAAFGVGGVVIGRAVRLLSTWKEEPDEEIPYPRVWVPPRLLRDLFDDVYGPIARDGATLVHEEDKAVLRPLSARI